MAGYTGTKMSNTYRREQFSVPGIANIKNTHFLQKKDKTDKINHLNGCFSADVTCNVKAEDTTYQQKPSNESQLYHHLPRLPAVYQVHQASAFLFFFRTANTLIAGGAATCPVFTSPFVLTSVEALEGSEGLYTAMEP